MGICISFSNVIITLWIGENMNICKCKHHKDEHSLVTTNCMKVISVICNQNGKWKEYYCTCSEYRPTQQEEVIKK